MLVEQTIEKLTSMRLHGMANALRQWRDTTNAADIEPVDLVGLLIDAEWIHRENSKLTARLRKAKFRQQACLEDIIYKSGRGISKNVISAFASSRWVAARQSIILTGPTGVGKSYIACALGNKACRDGFSVLYKRTSRLFDELAQARADGTYTLALQRLAKASVLIIDDFGLQPLTASERKDLLEVLEDRYDLASTVVTSQLEPGLWHAVIGDQTMADSICDRLVHGAHRIRLQGDSFRKPGRSIDDVTVPQPPSDDTQAQVHP